MKKGDTSPNKGKKQRTDHPLFRSRLRKRMGELGLSGNALAEKAGISSGLVSQYLSGAPDAYGTRVYKTPSLDKLASLAAALDVSLDYFTDESMTCSTLEKQGICDRTGLSDKAIDTLTFLKENSPECISALNLILETYNDAFRRGISHSDGIFQTVSKILDIGKQRLSVHVDDETVSIDSGSFVFVSGSEEEPDTLIPAGTLVKEQLLSELRHQTERLADFRNDPEGFTKKDQRKQKKVSAKLKRDLKNLEKKLLPLHTRNHSAEKSAQ